MQRFWQRKVWTQRQSRGEKLRCNFGKEKCKFFVNTKVQIFGKEKCKSHRQFQRYLGYVTSVSLSLSLSLSLSHRAHLTHNIGSASYNRKRFRASYYRASYNTERDREGNDVTLVALKLAMRFALFLAKNVHLTIGEKFCTFLAKILHLFLLSWMVLN